MSQESAHASGSADFQDSAPASGSAGFRESVPNSGSAGQQPPCRKCLISEIPGGEDLARIIRERIETLPASERCAPETVRRRLARCRQCDALNRGTCALCGCYVEIRAERAAMKCPAVPPQW